ncbi:MAG: hypothetical protein FP816_21010 [Desulfobacteraceae bacterium]|nr:hypothetical protein [Desulfobacteraceae bacterium]
MMEKFTEKDGYLYGPWRSPVNEWAGASSSIHNDDTARKVGMRGGTIPGTVHLNLFPPLMLELFGPRWFESGCISMFYAYATTDREEVRAIVQMPAQNTPDTLLEARVEARTDNRLVAQGTISMGNPAQPSYLHSLELKDAPPEELRILAGLKKGMKLPSKEVLIPREDAAKRVENITDPLSWYTGDSPWGGPILSVSAAYGALILVPILPKEQEEGSVGFFGATEIKYIHGPIKTDVPYTANGEILCVGASSKTEFYWYDSMLEEKESGKPVAKMRKLIRKMKKSSPLWA